MKCGRSICVIARVGAKTGLKLTTSPSYLRMGGVGYNPGEYDIVRLGALEFLWYNSWTYTYIVYPWDMQFV